MAEMTMRDQIAAAMYGPVSAGRGMIAECWASADEATRDYWRERTDAALGAMRKPTSAMLDAAGMVIFNGGHDLDDMGIEAARQVINAAVDAALSEHPQPQDTL